MSRLRVNDPSKDFDPYKLGCLGCVLSAIFYKHFKSFCAFGREREREWGGGGAEVVDRYGSVSGLLT